VTNIFTDITCSTSKNPRTDFFKVNLKILHSKFCSSPLSCPSIIKYSEASVWHLMKFSFKNIGHPRYSTNWTHPVLGIKRTLSVPQIKNMLQRSIFPVVPEIAKSYILAEEVLHILQKHYIINIWLLARWVG